MQIQDDELERFEAQGAAPLPETNQSGYVMHDGARIWYAAYGAGQPVILLHGGLGNSGNWGYQVPALLAQGYQVIVTDSRGHGRSTRDERDYSYELMAGDVLAVMDVLQLAQAAFVGWSDGADTALILADTHPERVTGVFFFACNVDASGTKELTDFPLPLRRCFSRHVQDYQQLSATPDDFEAFASAVDKMQRSQPNYTAAELGRIDVPFVVALGEHDEFIKREHLVYLAGALAQAEFVELPGVSHFAPLQRPDQFNAILLDFLKKIYP